MDLRASRVCQSFGMPPNPILSDINLDILSGEFIALTGRSGSGKSTLLYLLSTLDFAVSGEIYIAGKEIRSMTEKELHQFRNQKMGFVFQFHYLLPELTALENVLMPARKIRQEQQRAPYAKELLSQFGLGDKLESLPRQMSGGEQQRVAVARALVMEPSFLFADEPTGNLDSVNGETVMRIFREINQSKGTTIIMVTHDPDFAKVANRQIQLSDGRVIVA